MLYVKHKIVSVDIRGKYATSKKPVLISPKQRPTVVIPMRQDTAPNPDIAAALDAFDKMDSLQKAEILEEFAQGNALVAGRIRKSPESPFVRKTLGPWLAAKATAET